MARPARRPGRLIRAPMIMSYRDVDFQDGNWGLAIRKHAATTASQRACGMKGRVLDT